MNGVCRRAKEFFSPSSFLVTADAYNLRIMDVTQLTAQLQQALQLNQELTARQASLLEVMASLREENATLQPQYETLRHDYEALLASTQTLLEDREKQQRRVEELEAINQRLVDMLWGRRSERRFVYPDQLLLDFPEESALSEEEQAVIMAQQQADEAWDEQLVREAAARRRRRRAEQRQTREFPEHIERRERVLDLDEEEKAGLKCIGEVVTERMRFEKPHVYIERIMRPKVRGRGSSRAWGDGPSGSLEHRGRLQVRLQRDCRHPGPEVRLPLSDLSPARLVRPVWLASEPQHDQRADQCQRGRAAASVLADVALVVAASDSVNRRHPRVVADTQLAECGTARVAARTTPVGHAAWRRTTGAG